MPDGVVQWFDEATGTAAIVRASRTFPTRSAEVEPAARRAGAHVHFDVRREDGVDRAVDVRLRPGTRVSHHQKRFATLVGARRPDTKTTAPFARPHPDLGLSLASHPLEVARAWARCMQEEDIDTALLLYAPGAELHSDGQDVTGRAHVLAYLQASPLLGVEQDPEVRFDGQTVVLSFEAAPGQAAGLEVRCRIEHGQLAEQWISEAVSGALGVELETAGLPLNVVTRGDVDDDDSTYAARRLDAVLTHVGEPVLFARVKLTRAPDPARPRSAVAEAALDVNGELVRAQVAAHDMREAIDLLQRRLEDRLGHRAEHQEEARVRTGEAEPGEWRHGDLPALRPTYFDRPADERELVRHKTFVAEELIPDEAAFDMEQLDYDFYLFGDLASGEDALLERLSEGTFRLTRLHPLACDSGPTSIELVVAEQPAPRLAVGEAVQRLNDGGERFVFFENASTLRGNVVYRRYDGHYGLLSIE